MPPSYEYVRGSLVMSKATAAAAAAAAAGGAPTPAAAAAPPRYPEPRPLQDAAVASTQTERPVAVCGTKAPAGAPAPAFEGAFPPCAAAAGGGVCLVGLPGARDVYEEACAAMAACLEGGGGALAVYRAADVGELRKAAASGGGGAGAAGGGGAKGGVGTPPLPTPGGGGGGGGGWGAGEFDREILPGARLNCGARCACWAALQKRAAAAGGGAGGAGGGLLPGVFIGKRHALDLLNAAARLGPGAAGGGGGARANVTVFRWPYRHYDGTSMAAPHVAGGAARVWAAFPNCDAGDVARALRETAAPLPGANAVQAGAGMLQVEKAYLRLKALPCAAAGGGGGGNLFPAAGAQQPQQAAARPQQG